MYGKGFTFELKSNLYNKYIFLENILTSDMPTLNHFDDEGRPVYAEELIEKQPETIVLSNDITIDGFDAEISELNAVKSGRVIYIDSSCFERPTARLIEEFVASFGQKVNSLPEMKDFSTEITEEVPQEE